MLEFLQEVRAAGAVKRYHTIPTIGQETVSAHSYDVAVIVFTLTNREPSVNLLKAALFHDFAEIKTGDIPATFKESVPEINVLLKESENQLLEHWGILFELTQREKLILKWADLLSLLLFCVDQFEMGNRKLKNVFEKGLELIKSLDPLEQGELILDGIIQKRIMLR